jgi:hypothetical protein
MPETSEAKITSIAADMKNNPTATALVHGYASGSGGPEKLTTLADRWTSLVMYKVIWMVGDKMNTNEYRFELVSSPTPKGNFVEITVERPNL